jgi:hypothetical protein
VGHHGQVTEEKSPVEQAVDLLVYAPLGFALEARELLPRWVDRGRQQVTMARMIGKFAVQQGQTEATKALGRASEQATAVLNELARTPGPSTSSASRPSPAPSSSTAASATSPSVNSVTAPPSVDLRVPPAAVAMAKASPGALPGAASENLAIADYDSLAASQVIPRLPGLSGGELEDVRSYEAGHRGRKTILNRIAQLQSV